METVKKWQNLLINDVTIPCKSLEIELPTHGIATVKRETPKNYAFLSIFMV